MYLSVAGCKDWQDWTCNDYGGTDPVVHFTTEFWTKWKVDSWLSDIASINPLVHSRVVHTGVMGYVGPARMYVWTWAKDRAKLWSNVSLDWHEDLMGESALPYFTVLKDMNMTFSLYQLCEYTDFEQCTGMCTQLLYPVQPAFGKEDAAVFSSADAFPSARRSSTMSWSA